MAFSISVLKEQWSGRRMKPSLPGDIAAGFSEGELSPSLNGHVNGRPVNLPFAVGEPWVGIVANRSSGTGGNNLLVRRLVGKLAKLGFGTEVAWTPVERQTLVAEAESRRGAAAWWPWAAMERSRRWSTSNPRYRSPYCRPEPRTSPLSILNCDAIPPHWPGT